MTTTTEHIDMITSLPRGTALMVCEPVQVRTSMFMGSQAADLMPGKHIYIESVNQGRMIVRDVCGDFLSFELCMCDHLEVVK